MCIVYVSTTIQVTQLRLTMPIRLTSPSNKWIAKKHFSREARL